VIALSALGRCRCFLAVRSDKGEAAFPSAKRPSIFFVRSTKCPCCRRTLRHISAPWASMSFRFSSFSGSLPAFSARPFRNDDGRPVFCCSGRLARAHFVLALIIARARGNFDRPSDLEQPIFAGRAGARRLSLDLCRTTKPPLLIVAVFALGESRCLFAIGTRAEL